MKNRYYLDDDDFEKALSELVRECKEAYQIQKNRRQFMPRLWEKSARDWFAQLTHLHKRVRLLMEVSAEMQYELEVFRRVTSEKDLAWHDKLMKIRRAKNK